MSLSTPFDASSFLGGMDKLLRDMPKIKEKVIIETLVQVGVYAQTVKPTVPMKDGHLRGSMVIDMEKEGVGAITFTKPQAARLDDPTRFPVKNWTEPGSGKKYLSGKFKTFKDALGKKAAEIATRELENAD